jgi:phosphopantothenoylcysteine decarboxylase/phosphopantothenate--cysteine ligase
MFLHPGTQANIKTLKSYGNILIPPATGELASGLCGEGRMEEPEGILELIKSFFLTRQQFEGKTVLVSAGPTFEAIDPVRYLGNHSSGKMGYALAEEFARRGARVILVSGPTELDIEHPQIERIGVMSAQQMFESCMNLYPGCDISVMAAAVADYTPSRASDSKIKKEKEKLVLELEPTMDILETMGKSKKKGQLLVGFALESENEIDNAKAKLKKKSLDLIILNSLKDAGAGFKHDTNKVSFIEPSGKVHDYPMKSKKEVAQDILDAIGKLVVQ